MRLDTIDPTHVFEVDAPNVAFPGGSELGYACRCPVVGSVVGVKPTLDATGLIVEADVLPGVATADAVSFVFSTGSSPPCCSSRPPPTSGCGCAATSSSTRSGRAVDAEFTRAQLPTGDRPSGSEYGIQGGFFESWFTPQDKCVSTSRRGRHAVPDSDQRSAVRQRNLEHDRLRV